jgi:hypothetical protein
LPAHCLLRCVGGSEQRRQRIDDQRDAQELLRASQYNTLQHRTTRCNTAQHVASQYNTLQRSTTRAAPRAPTSPRGERAAQGRAVSRSAAMCACVRACVRACKAPRGLCLGGIASAPHLHRDHTHAHNTRANAGKPLWRSSLAFRALKKELRVANHTSRTAACRRTWMAWWGGCKRTARALSCRTGPRSSGVH